MKKSKHGRKIGYGVAGLAIGLAIYLLLKSNIPLSVDARSTLMEFANEQQTSEYVLDDEDYNGLVKKPFLEYGSYHVSSVDFDRYEKNHVVKYGKPNPTFFLEREVPEEEEETEEEGSQEIKAPSRPSDSTGGSENEGESDLTGFNIKTTQEEKASAEDVAHIKNQFRSQAVLPVDEEHYVISSKFGIRVDPFEKVNAYHVGLDMATITIEGANIYSALGGEVIEKGTGDKGLGNYVVIEHNGFETLYAHMVSPTHLEVGDSVSAGDILGYVGSTGRSTGPHLHFEVGIGSLKLDPEVFINEIK